MRAKATACSIVQISCSQRCTTVDTLSPEAKRHLQTAGISTRSILWKRSAGCIVGRGGTGSVTFWTKVQEEKEQTPSLQENLHSYAIFFKLKLYFRKKRQSYDTVSPLFENPKCLPPKDLRQSSWRRWREGLWAWLPCTFTWMERNNQPCVLMASASRSKHPENSVTWMTWKCPWLPSGKGRCD